MRQTAEAVAEDPGGRLSAAPPFDVPADELTAAQGMNSTGAEKACP